MYANNVCMYCRCGCCFWIHGNQIFVLISFMKKKEKENKGFWDRLCLFFFSSFICFYFSNWIEFEEDCQCFILLTARNDNDDHQWPNDQSIHRSLVFFSILFILERSAVIYSVDDSKHHLHAIKCLIWFDIYLLF